MRYRRHTPTLVKQPDMKNSDPQLPMFGLLRANECSDREQSESALPCYHVIWKAIIYIITRNPFSWKSALDFVGPVPTVKLFLSTPSTVFYFFQTSTPHNIGSVENHADRYPAGSIWHSKCWWTICHHHHLNGRSYDIFAVLTWISGQKFSRTGYFLFPKRTMSCPDRWWRGNTNFAMYLSNAIRLAKVFKLYPLLHIHASCAGPFTRYSCYLCDGCSASLFTITRAEWKNTSSLLPSLHGVAIYMYPA